MSPPGAGSLLDTIATGLRARTGIAGRATPRRAQAARRRERAARRARQRAERSGKAELRTRRRAHRVAVAFLEAVDDAVAAVAAGARRRVERAVRVALEAGCGVVAD